MNNNIKLIILSILIFSNTIFANELNLTNEEKVYLKNNPIIKAHNETSWAPFNYNENGVAKGFNIDYMNLLASKIGIDVEYISGYSWAEFMEMLSTSKLDVIINISKNKSRAKSISFTDSFVSVKNAIYVNKTNDKFNNLDDLKNHTIAMPKGFFTQKYLEKNYPKIKQVLVRDSLEALKLLSLGKVDATIEKKIVTDYIIEDKLISNIMATQYIEDNDITSHVRLGSSKKDKILIDILQKAQDSVTNKEMKKLKSKWFGAKMKPKTKQNTINFTKQEKHYLENKKELTVCVKKDWLPYESFENNEFIGISADFLNLYSSQLSIPLKIITAPTQNEVLKLLKEQKCDIKPLGEMDKKLRVPYKSTNPYITDNIVLVTKMEQPFVSDLNRLKETVVMVKGFKSFIDYIKKDYPLLKIKEVDDINIALKLVSTGKYYGYIGTSLSASYQIQKKFSSALKIVNDFKEIKKAIGVRDDDVILLNILNKLMLHTLDIEKRKILNSWIAITIEKEQDYTLIWKVASVLIIILLIIIYFLIKQNRLKNKIEDLNSSLEDKIEEATKDLLIAQKLAKIGSWRFCNSKNKLSWSDETYRIFEIDKNTEQISSIEDFIKYIHPDDIEILTTAYDKHMKEQAPYFITHRIITKNGNIKYVEERSETNFYADDNPLISNGTIQDITEKKLQKNKLKEKEEQMLHQSRLAQMGEMISMIAHQWRQPLNAISLTSSNLKFKCMMDDYDKDIFEKEIDLIDEYSQHLSKTIDDFRGFFKENKEKEETSLEDIVNSTLDIVKTSVETKGITINTDLQCDEKFETYPNEVKQVVLNLIKNAEDVLLDNNTKNPTITIQTLCDETKDIKTIIVKDNGGGIPQDIKDNIFDPYFSTKKEKDGTGLGLYMSKTIIEEHCGGRLSVSDDEDGAVFEVRL